MYVARCLEVEVTSQGESVEEALANLKEALELYFEDSGLPRNLEPPVIAAVELSAVKSVAYVGFVLFVVFVG